MACVCRLGPIFIFHLVFECEDIFPYRATKYTLEPVKKWVAANGRWHGGGNGNTAAAAMIHGMVGHSGRAISQFYITPIYTYNVSDGLTSFCFIVLIRTYTRMHTVCYVIYIDTGSCVDI